MNWFLTRGEVSAGAVEVLDNKVKLVTRKSYGFRTPELAKLALLHNIGNLPEPNRTHSILLTRPGEGEHGRPRSESHVVGSDSEILIPRAAAP